MRDNLDLDFSSATDAVKTMADAMQRFGEEIARVVRAVIEQNIIFANFARQKERRKDKYLLRYKRRGKRMNK